VPHCAGHDSALTPLLTPPKSHSSTLSHPHINGVQNLAFTRCFHSQCCMVYGIHKGVRVGGCILPNRRAIVLQQCGQCRRAGRKKGRLSRAHTYSGKTISCERQSPGGCKGKVQGPAPRRLAFTRYSFTPERSFTSSPSFYFPLHLYCSHDCNAFARLMCNIRPPPDPPCVCNSLYNIGNNNIV